MSWDDEDFDVPVGKDTAVMDDWENEDLDEPLLDGDSWDVDEDEEKAKREAEAKKKKEEQAKKDAQVAAEKAKKAAALKKFDTADPAKRKQLLKEAELEADLTNAADLFGGLGVAEEHPRAKALRAEQAAAEQAAANAVLTAETPITEHPLFRPETKQDFEKLRKALVPVFQDFADKSLLNYSSGLGIDLVRELTKPMSVENIRKVISTLNVVLKDKERAERQARLAKSGGGVGKKKAKGKVNLGGGFKKEEYTDTTNYDDFDDDDFM
ncbi:translation initiation factor eIF3 core subunit J [Saccharomycopsis crataegensis]|uniref:Eukaryotic translation initiation factor 3 subunit J n=1 Tax=Saccharomycopsis crataegensis TaxID=43959 RepID=A0AAV5QQ02_9ASCO|nr:translation initiation factor eIF3 core subunit J [Saccharomycopsis crataegensis]